MRDKLLLLYSSLGYVVRCYGGLFLFFWALCLWVDIRYVLYHAEVNGMMADIVPMLLKSIMRDTIACLLLLCLLSLCGRGRFRTTLLVLCLLSGTLLYWTEVFLFSQSGMIYGYAAIQSMAGSNAQEASEYFQTVDLGELIPSALLFLLVASIGMAWTKALGLGESVNTPPQSENKCKCFFISGGLSLLLLLPWLWLQVSHYQRVKEERQVYLAASSPLERFVWNTYGYLEEARVLSRQLAQLSSIKLGAVTREPGKALLPREANIVIIIGETLRRDYMHCYGYDLPNTPRLDSLITVGDVIPYIDAISPACWTIGSLTKILTFANNHSEYDWSNYPTLPSAMRELGYRVVWRSNQESHGTLLQPLVALANTSSTVERTGYFSADDSYRSLHYDEDILALAVDSLGAQSAEGNMYIYHLMGSHQKYSQRFPASWAKFGPDDVKRPELDEDERQVVADYINSIYYNDYVVSSLIKTYSNSPSLVLYFSDHGEMLYDNPNNPTYAGHTLLSKCAEVPFLVYMSPQLRTQAPALYSELAAYKDRPIMLDSFSDALFGLMGLSCKYTSAERNFWGPEYDATRPRVLKGANNQETLVYTKTQE